MSDAEFASFFGWTMVAAIVLSFALIWWATRDD